MSILEAAMQLAVDYHTLALDQLAQKYGSPVTEELLVQRLRAALEWATRE